MREFKSVLDGKLNSNPRAEQIEYFEHLQSNWAKFRIHAAELPPGIGKSYIARTVQRTLPNTAIVTCNNELVDQYCRTYPDLNAVKGKDYHDSDEDYKESRKRALHMDCVFNPLSYYYFYLCRPELPRPTTVVIDEAHKLGDMLLLTVSQSLDCGQFSIPPGLTDTQFLTWIQGQLNKLKGFYKENAVGNRMKLSSMYEKLVIIEAYLSKNMSTVETKYEMKADRKGKMREHFTITPLEMPSSLLDTIFGPDTRMLLLSGTLPAPALQELYPNESKIDFVRMEHPAVRAKNPIHFKPISHGSRRDTATLAKAIRETYDSYGRPNTLCHVSYSMGATLAPLLRDVPGFKWNTQETKSETIASFKKTGGLLLGGGMAEGVDLPGDECRLIIIPLILYPNLGAQSVIKRMAMQNGQFWYGLETLMTTIQQIGRGCRGADDYCDVVIMDATWLTLINKYAAHITPGFKERLK